MLASLLLPAVADLRLTDVKFQDERLIMWKQPGREHPEPFRSLTAFICSRTCVMHASGCWTVLP